MSGIFRWFALLPSVALMVFIVAAQARQAPPPKFVGTWKMTWRGCVPVNAEFRSDGSYYCDWVDGQTWHGSWTYDRAEDKLTVAECPAGGAAQIVWEVEFETGSLRGSCTGELFELKK